MIFIERCSVDILIEVKVGTKIPLLVYVLEIAAQLLPASIAFLEGEVFPEFFVVKLIYRSVCVYAGPGIAIPVPSQSILRSRQRELRHPTYQIPPNDDPFSYTLASKPCFRSFCSKVIAPNPPPIMRQSTSLMSTSPTEPMMKYEPTSTE